MDISTDYLDINSDKSCELFEPIKETLKKDQDVVIKSIEIFLRFQDQQTSTPHIHHSRVDYPVLPDPSLTDRELYNFIKARIESPPEDDDEKAMTPEELRKERDPEGIFQHPFESEIVQENLKLLRAYIEKNRKRGEFYKVQKCYTKVIQNAIGASQEYPQGIQLSDLQVTVVYTKRSDPSSTWTTTRKPEITNDIHLEE